MTVYEVRQAPSGTPVAIEVPDAPAAMPEPFAAYAWGAPNFELVEQNQFEMNDGEGTFIVSWASTSWEFNLTNGRLTYVGPAGKKWMVCHQLAHLISAAVNQGVAALSKNGDLIGSTTVPTDGFRQKWVTPGDNLMTMLYPVEPAPGDYFDLVLNAPGGDVPRNVTGDTWTIRAWCIG